MAEDTPRSLGRRGRVSGESSAKDREALRAAIFQWILYFIVAVLATMVDWRFHQVVAVVMWFVVVLHPFVAIHDAWGGAGMRDIVHRQRSGFDRKGRCNSNF